MVGMSDRVSRALRELADALDEEAWLITREEPVAGANTAPRPASQRDLGGGRDKASGFVTKACNLLLNPEQEALLQSPHPLRLVLVHLRPRHWGWIPRLLR